jgi:hypothetical protein
VYFPPNSNGCDKIRESQMDGTCNTLEGRENWIQTFSRKILRKMSLEM